MRVRGGREKQPNRIHKLFSFMLESTQQNNVRYFMLSKKKIARKFLGFSRNIS